MRNTHTAQTFKPYNPAETLGNNTPSTPMPQDNSDGCGVGGQIILAAIAIAVTIVTQGALTAQATAAAK